MNTFSLAFTSALVDFVWQGALVALALLVALRTAGRRSARVRYALSAASLVVLLAAPIVTMAWRYDSVDGHDVAMVTRVPSSILARPEDRAVFPVISWRSSAPSLTTIQPWILPIWSLGVTLLSLRLLAGGLEVRALRRSAQPVDDVLRERLSILATRMGIRRDVTVATSHRADGASAIGWLRPLILLPPATILGLTTTQLDAVLAHELAHIRRHDYLVNVIQMAAETLLFYHPAVWWVSKRLRIERELCCDDEAVSVCGDATAYARALVTMARQQAPAMAMSSAGGSLRDRVHRLLGITGHEPRRSAAFAGIAIALALLSIALARVGAQAERPRFDVASIKPAAAGTRFDGPLIYPGGVVRHSRVPLFFLIAVAYDVPFMRVESNSDVVNQRYAIDARADSGALPPPGSTIQRTMQAQVPVVREMLKTLLAERFKLALHVETRDTPIYALVVNDNRLRLTPAARDCEPTTLAEYQSGKGPCGIRGGGPANGFHLHGSELADLANGLSGFVGRPIIDRTGISGRFDIDLPPWSTGAPPRPDSDEPQPEPNGPSIFTVLQQLGLRLEPARGPITYYVVDHVERPSPN
ncbi:MAG TPA: M56 family metallopeptidase [Vicinamibacterales bacterium]|nr:M56 family metallopeptidase [Vicinamibacterales bacterium]